ncbi:SDR family oxidoreductase [Sphingobacterium alkalisoli]|uniref:SDR family oxidoreductase n=1 Tax=Sphingobacterium alkalisoli TaxID=1874115 RepID=A0A4V6WF14_9SPHI|nr:SDR family oxidoreductase [Sphingobacterium alkalisoli]TJY61459.1 SDR family oxidoreductase [Sphingobacterium alkalisoli]GGH30272.1 short-chain dehydrogenase [Sphingobacterium alkalisoli]
MQEYKGKIVLISGGLGDIALAIARAYLDNGAVVALSDRLTAEQAITKLQDFSFYVDRLNYQSIDVTDGIAVQGWVQGLATKYGRIDISIVNAAQVTLKNFIDLSFDEWQLEQRVNVDGAFFLASASAKVFKESLIKGNIVFLGSWAAHAVHAHLPAYSVSKAAVRMLCQSMALEFAPFGIRINEVAPGYVNAGLSKAVWEKSPASQQSAKAAVPLGEIIEVEDIARQVLWITSENNKHMTGATVLMDGGLSLIRP